MIGLFTPDPPTNITSTNIAWVKLSGKSPIDLGIPPFKINIMLDSNPPKSTMSVRGLAVYGPGRGVIMY